MVRRMCVTPVRTVLAAVMLLGINGLVGAQTVTEFSSEARFQLDLQVPDAGIKPFLPPGWSLNVATQGAAKDCNLRLIFVDRVTINAPDGKPVGSNRLAYLAVPVKDASGANAQLVIGGLTADPKDAPGPFGNYLPATTHTMRRSSSSNGSGPTIDTQDWEFRAATGERLEMHIEYERGVGNKGAMNEVRFYSAKDPSTYQISKQEQVLEILRNPTTKPPDRVKKFSFKGSGGSYAKIFDGTEKVVSWDNILWINRSVMVP
jgi:hypothetical protein